MARDTITVTDTWQQIATGAVTITIKSKGTDQILFNEIASDTDALCWGSNLKGGNQFTQDQALPTWVRSDGSHWELIVDGVL